MLRRAGILAALSMVWILLAIPEVQAQDRKWTVSPMLGIHQPRLTDLNKGEFRAPLPGRGRLILDGVEEGVEFDFMVENPLPEMAPGAEAGIEISLNLDRRNAIFFGASVWESGSTARMSTEIPFQGAMTPVGYERSGRISYFQYFLGWERKFQPEQSRFNFYSRIALHEVFDIDYKEDLVLGFQPPGNETFNRFIIMESQATGHFMLQLGFGGEYHLRDWLSLGADLGYTLSASKFKLGNATLTSDIQAEDNLNFRTPVRLDAQQQLEFLSAASSFEDVTYSELELDFNGWRALFRVNMHF